jgi:hypothetical protein
MTEASTSTPVATGRPDDLSIVLFGMPAAGKSSLLGALAQAAQAQEHLLNGRLTDVSHGLDELRRRVYDENPRRTAEEVVPYPVDFEPFSQDGNKATASQHLGAVVIDCDGRVANDLLVRRQALAEDSPEGTLAHEVVEADTLVLVIDASAPATQIESDFVEFDRFLRQLEISRSQRAEVGGLPVFLVLTKCDLLAQPTDKAADWMERIEQHKRDVDARFRAFLARREQEAGPLPFGRIDLHLWATAIKRPALVGSPAKAREPYGVAELFRQCLEQAAAFRNRRRQSSRRLLWTVGAATGIVGAMTALIVTLTLKNLDTKTNELQSKVQIIRFGDLPSAAERLHGTANELRRRAENLTEIRDDPQFAALPEEQRQLIRDRLDELNAYLIYFNRLRQSPRPQDARTEKALQEIKENLRTELALPHADWSATEAGRLHADRLQDANALETAVKRTRNWYQSSTETAANLWTLKDETLGRDWAHRVDEQLDRNGKPPFTGATTVPNAASTLTYDATVLQFENVVKARTDWETDQERLRRLLDLTAALGLTDVTDRPPVLVVTKQFTLPKASEKRASLERDYPNYQREFIFERVPEAIRAQVSQTARDNYDKLLQPARAAVLKQLQEAGGGTEETASRWATVVQWLRTTKDFDDWSVLAGVLIRLRSADPDAVNPVRALEEFLSKKSFTIKVQRLTLEIPESLDVKPLADAKLSIFHPASAGEKPALVFEQPEEQSKKGGERDTRRHTVTYSFLLGKGEGLIYRPGDALWATLPLRDDLTFTWVRGRSLTYQFERLTRPPRLHKKNEATTSGTLEAKVHLTITPSNGVPSVPDLLPVVKLK